MVRIILDETLNQQRKRQDSLRVSRRTKIDRSRFEILKNRQHGQRIVVAIFRPTTEDFLGRAASRIGIIGQRIRLGADRKLDSLEHVAQGLKDTEPETHAMSLPIVMGMKPSFGKVSTLPSV